MPPMNAIYIVISLVQPALGAWYAWQLAHTLGQPPSRADVRVVIGASCSALLFVVTDVCYALNNRWVLLIVMAALSVVVARSVLRLIRRTGKSTIVE